VLFRHQLHLDRGEALGVDAASLGLARSEESIEQLGQVTTFDLDLETLWQAESGRRRLEGTDTSDLLDIVTTFPVEPSTVWAHLTSPALRSLWEGPLVIDETSPGGRRGVGTVARCVTGRLATLEDIVDWQPYDRVGWRLAMPDLGPVEATADLSVAEEGTRLRLRWATAAPAADQRALDRVQKEKRAAIARLGKLLGQPMEARGEGGTA